MGSDSVSDSSASSNSPRVIFWETVNWRASDGSITVTTNGQYQRRYDADSAAYAAAVTQLSEKYPELKPGKIVFFDRYDDGTSTTRVRTMEEIIRERYPKFASRNPADLL